MSKRCRFFFAFLALILSTEGMAALPTSDIEINGELVKVFFNDGDTFRIISGSLAGYRSRIEGFNTLESYGPVHQWGAFKREELLEIAKAATWNARRGGWHCTTDLSHDTYGRLLSVCTDLAIDHVRKGLAHVMTVDEEPGDATLIAKQQEAIKMRVGMWAKGTPKFVVTSLHSIDENKDHKDHKETYDRLVSTDDGHSEMQMHHNKYRDCEEVCYSSLLDERSHATVEKACMVYVAYNNRFDHSKASCLD